MTTELQQQVKAWKNLKVLMEKIQDPCLKTAMLAEFRKRAINEWGFDPETSQPATADNIPFDDLEKEVLEAIKAYNEFGVRTKRVLREEESKKAQLNMYRFVKSGGTLVDLPEDLRNSPCISDMYFKALRKVYGIE